MPATVTSGLAVVIPCRDEASYIEQALDAISHRIPAPEDVIVVDGGSTDGMLEDRRTDRGRTCRA